MTDGTEQALEYVAGGILFCIAVSMLLWLNTAFLQQMEVLGRAPERLILFEQKGE